jgi:uncharacterized cupredoxin-like copper-binding protein
MRHRRGLAAALAVVASAVAVGAAQGASASTAGKVTFKASYAGQATVKRTGDAATISASGKGTGVPIGTGTITGVGTGDTSSQPCATWLGTGVLKGTKGTLNFKVLPGGQACGDESGVASIVAKAQALKGTGVLKGAKGTLKVTGVYDDNAGTFSAKFNGTLTTSAATTPKMTTLALAANARNKLAFTKKKLSAPAGKIKLVMKNPSGLRHNIAVRNGISMKSKLIKKGKVVGKGGVSTVVVTLTKGKYRYVCTVPGHEAAGMWGILTVK